MIIYSLIFLSYRKRDKDKMYNKTSFLLGRKRKLLYGDFVELLYTDSMRIL